jgi:hypothetical protein
MIKLLEAFKNNPTLATATKLVRHVNKYPMASAILPREAHDVLLKAHRMYLKEHSVSMGRPSITVAQI